MYCCKWIQKPEDNLVVSFEKKFIKFHCIKIFRYVIGLVPKSFRQQWRSQYQSGLGQFLGCRFAQ